ncbi:MAG: FG-GAP-like repeat-containing protein [Lentisphaeria bacterium]|nr:FG-GAP-like repeat-containing protein [Lentisphaeria bacterium]
MTSANASDRIRAVAPLTFVVAALFLLLPGFAQAGAFEDKTKEFTGLENIGDNAASFGDFNDDGHVDLQTGGGGFENVDGKKYKKSGGGSGWLMWGDMNNDGHLDKVGASGRIDLGDGIGGFKAGNGPPGPFGGECVAGGLGDINNDGLLDIYYGGGSGAKDTLWRQDPDHEKKWVQVAELGGAYARGVVVCDFDEDNDADFYVSNYWLAANYLWVSDGEGGSTNQAGHFGATGGNGHSIGACWGDVDNDGYFDIFAGNFAHPGQPQSRFLHNLGPDQGYKFADKGQCGVGFQESYASPTLGDYDNDGDLDLFFTTVYGHNAARLYRNNGDWTFTDVTGAEGIPRLGSTYQAAWGDVDSDGDLDLVTNGRLFMNKGNDNHWLKIRLEGNGMTVNRSAIGARVRIKLGDKTLSRQVEGGGVGQGNQNDPTLHFGLGTHGGKVEYEVVWTDGTRQVGESEVDNMIRVSQSGDNGVVVANLRAKLDRARKETRLLRTELRTVRESVHSLSEAQKARDNDLEGVRKEVAAALAEQAKKQQGAAGDQLAVIKKEIAASLAEQAKRQGAAGDQLAAVKKEIAASLAEHAKIQSAAGDQLNGRMDEIEAFWTKPWKTFPGILEDTLVEGYTLPWGGDAYHPLAVQAGNIFTLEKGTGIVLSNGAYLTTNEPCTALTTALSKAGDLTLEVVMRPANLTQAGPARIVSISHSYQSRNLTLGQSGDRAVVRFRTTETSTNGTNPVLNTQAGALTGERQHLVFVRKAGTHTLYVDGTPVVSLAVPGDLSTWDHTMPLLVGNETEGNRTWEGEVYGVTFFSRALTAEEISRRVPR